MLKKISKTNIFLHWLKGYIYLLITALVLMSGVRLLWFKTYRKGDELTHFFNDFLNSLWLGFRFDLSAFCHLSLLSFLIWMIWLLIGPRRWASSVLILQRRLWIFLMIFLSFILAADFAYYGYFQDHFNALIFGLIQDDTNAILKTVWKNYPVISIAIGLTFTVWMLNRWFNILWKPPTTNPVFQPSWRHRSLAILSFFAVALGARGTLGLFPLEIMHTAISSHAFINALSFNGVHALAHAIQLYDQQHQAWNENLLQLGYANNPRQALVDFKDSLNLTNEFFREDLLLRMTSKKPQLQPLPHVVVVLMESWGSDWMKKNSPQFNVLGAFAKHMTEDLFTPYIMPSSVATIGSLGSLAVDLPHRFYSPFLTESSFLGVKFATAPADVFKKQGYQTHFIYGGNLGWRSIDKFLPRQGFQYLHGENEIKKLASSADEEEISHDWGVYDEFVFQYAQQLLENATQPQFLFILTTSNHPPYTLPKHYKVLPLDFTPEINQLLIGDLRLNQDRLKVFQYSNQQLGLFLNDLKKGPLSSRTVVAATGDHSFYIRPYETLEFFEKWSVPLYVYLPSPYKDQVTKKLTIGNHIDLFPTLYNLIFSELPFQSLGQDLLNSQSVPWAFHGPSWSSFSEKYGILVNAKGAIITTLCRNDLQKFEACTGTESHEKLRKYLVSMMGTADFLFENQRQEKNQETAGK